MTRQAVVFSPVMPVWDSGAAVEPIRRALAARGYAAHVVDTCALASRADSIDQLADLWAQQLLLDRIDLVCGNALGGSVAIALAARIATPVPVLTVSGPARTTPLLRNRLKAISTAAAAGRLEESLAELHRRVVDEPDETTGPAELPLHSRAAAAERIVTGLTLLQTVDLDDVVRVHRARIISIIGERSQLVGAEHTARGPHCRTVSVPGTGMRPHHTHPSCVDTALADLGLPPTLETLDAACSPTR